MAGKFTLILILPSILLITACSTPAAPPAMESTPNLHDIPTPERTQPGQTLNAVPLWTASLTGAVNVTPIASGDLIVIATSDGVIHALHALSGEPAWEFAPGAKAWDASLSVDDELVCTGLEGGLVACLFAATGEAAWTVDLGYEVQSPMVLTPDRVYAPTTHVGTGLEADYSGKAVLFALSRGTGETVWEAETENYILRRPMAAGDLVVAGGVTLNAEDVGVMRLYAFRTADGSPAWQIETDDGLVRWIERAGDVLLYAAHSETVHALDLATGEHLWSYGPGYWIQFPAIRDGVLYFGTGDQFMQALMAADGTVLWETEINLDALSQIGLPIIADDTLWFNSVTGEIYGLQVSSGEIGLHLATGHTSRVGGALFENLYVMGDPDGNVYAYTIK
jgi:outer membrane protein assembly factor BamB